MLFCHHPFIEPLSVYLAANGPRFHASVPANVDIPQPPPDVIQMPPSPHPVPPSPEVPPEIIDPVPPGGNQPVRDPIEPSQQPTQRLH